MSDETNGGVGYKRPPREHCWKKGQSGNPRGRPPGLRNLSAAITAVLNEQVDGAVDGEERRMTRLEVVVRQFIGKAEAGDPRVMPQLIAEIHKNEAKAERDASSQPLADVDRQVMDAFVQRVARDAASANHESERADPAKAGAQIAIQRAGPALPDAEVKTTAGREEEHVRPSIPKPP